MRCEAVRSAILATAWLLVFIFAVFDVPHYVVIWYDKVINYVFAFIFAVLSPVSDRTR